MDGSAEGQRTPYGFAWVRCRYRPMGVEEER